MMISEQYTEREHERISSTKILASKRKKFLVNFILTLSLVAILLVLTFVGLNAQDTGGQSARRDIVAPPDAQARNLGAPINHQQELQPLKNADYNLAASNVPDGYRPNPNQTADLTLHHDGPTGKQEHNDSSLSNSSGARQTRSTTRRRLTSTSSTTASPTLASVSDSSQQQSDLESTGTPGRNISSLPASNGTQTDEISSRPNNEAELEEEQAKLDRARRRRLKERRKKEGSQRQQTTLSPSSTTTQPPTTTTSTTTTTTTTTISPNASETSQRTSLGGERTNKTEHLPHSRHAARIDSNKTSNRLADFPQVKVPHRHQPNITLNTAEGSAYEDDYYDDYEDEIRDVHLANKLSALTSAPNSTNSVKRYKVDAPELNQAGSHHGNHSTHLLHQANATSEQTKNHSLALDGRSPGPLGKRITDMIAERTKSRPAGPQPAGTNKPVTFQPSTSTPASIISTTTASAPTIPTPSMIVQATNQTGSNNTAKGEKDANITTHLDWSKLVKVVFKSAHDNHTVHTVVMNSSELSQHPISDWTQELPILLERDFEKLVQKWSSVLPMDWSKDLRDKLTLNIYPNATRSINGTSTSPSPFNSTLAPGALKSHSDVSSTTTMKPLISAVSVANSTTTGYLTGNTNTLSTNQPIAINSTKPLIVVNSTNQPIAMNSINQPNVMNSTRFAINATKNATETFDPSRQITKLDKTVVNVTTPATTTIRQDQLTNVPKVTASPTSSADFTTASLIEAGKAANKTITQQPQYPGRERNGDLNDKSIHEVIRNLRNENLKIEDDVREQGSSLRHFIIICSVSVVVATSLMVALIVLLFK
jgi:hypothetical protein